ncbi:MAG: RIP metalloprotease RseP [Candidatus Acidiferrales bacterium]
MGSLLRDVIAGAAVLGVLILLHEWGHFIVAKLCGVRVEVFSIGFGRRLWGVKRGDTDYRVSALPLGGYVRMAGDNPSEQRTGAPDEFLSRPRWQRLLIAIAGPSMNIFVAFAVFWGIYAFKGMPSETYVRQPAVVAAVPENSAGAPGVEPGDRIVEVNGVNTPVWEDVLAQVDKAKPGDSLSVVVSRGGSQETLKIPVPAAQASPDSEVGYPALPPVADDVTIGSPAEKAGMQSGDEVVSINGKPVVTWPQLVEQVRDSGGNSIHFVVRRGGKEIPLDITPMRTMTPDGQMAWLIGVTEKTTEFFERQSLLESTKDAGLATVSGLRQIGSVLAGLVTGKVPVRGLGGPVFIVQLSGEAAKSGPLILLQFLAALSLNLAVLNLLPIPILDGGHVLMLAIESVIGRDLSVAVKERFVQVGLVFLLGVFAFVMYSDILRVIQTHIH